jgi:hypothetical protein
MENVIAFLAIAFVGGMIGAWFRIVRFLMFAVLVLLLGFAGFTLISIIAPDLLGLQPPGGPSEGLGAGAAILMVFVLPALLVGLLVFGVGWGLGWMARQATAPPAEDPEVAAKRRAAETTARMEEIRQRSGRTSSDPTPGRGSDEDASP